MSNLEVSCPFCSFHSSAIWGVISHVGECRGKSESRPICCFSAASRNDDQMWSHVQKHHQGQFLQRKSGHLLELPEDLNGVGNISWYNKCVGLITPRLVVLKEVGGQSYYLCHLGDLIGRELDTVAWAWCH